ncbi:MAG: hypothetical protein WBA22_13660 [Candidatus Methanofastidiosia archaeon]
MNPKYKMYIGAVLASIGGLGILLSFLLGAMDLGRPFDFLIGFAVGVSTGLGTVLSINGLLERRRRKESADVSKSYSDN